MTPDAQCLKVNVELLRPTNVMLVNDFLMMRAQFRNRGDGATGYEVIAMAQHARSL